jgi:hypothetical protein
MFPSKSKWIQSRDGDGIARDLFMRHYSYRKYADGRQPKLFVGPGEKLVLVTINYDALFVWRKFMSMDNQDGVNCAVFRNESDYLSSDLIMDAERWAYDRWGRVRLYTYVNPDKIRSSNPGYCFLKAGWCKCGHTGKGLLILEKQ